MRRGRIWRSTASWSARRSSTSCSRSWRATSIRWNAAVVSICVFQAGHTDNVIPQHARLHGTARSLTPQVRELLQKRVARGGRGHRAALRRQGEAHLHQRLSGAGQPRAGRPRSPPTVAREIAGDDKVDTDCAADDGRGGFRLHAAASGRAHSSLSATATAPGCITRPTISTTKRSRSGPRIGCGSRRPRWRVAHILKSLPADLIRGWLPVFEKDHAQVKSALLRRFDAVIGRHLGRLGYRLGDGLCDCGKQIGRLGADDGRNAWFRGRANRRIIEAVPSIAR